MPTQQRKALTVRELLRQLALLEDQNQEVWFGNEQMGFTRQAVALVQREGCGIPYAAIELR